MNISNDNKILAEIYSESSCKLLYNKKIPLHGYYIYVIRENGIIKYIGKGKKNRVISHFTNSSNQYLKSLIKENRNIFDWEIIALFDEEVDAFDLEEKLIIDCKNKNHKLYNKVHYSHYGQYNSEIRQIFNVLKQYENMVFINIKSSKNILTPYECTKIIKNIIDKLCSKMILIPMYKGKKINELNFNLCNINGLNKIIVQ